MHSSQDAGDTFADRGKLDAAANPSFDELSGTLCSEIAQRLPRYPVRLHVYDLGQAKGISGLNIVTKGLQMVRPRSHCCSVYSASYSLSCYPVICFGSGSHLALSRFPF